MAKSYVWQIVKCFAGRHDYKVHQEFGALSRRIICPYCRGDWGMNDAERIMTEWNGEFEELYTSFGFSVKPVNWKKELKEASNGN